MNSNIRHMNIGQAIRQIRESRQSTLEEVAFAADTNASNLSRIERGVQGYSAETLERIAQALGMTVAELHLYAESTTGSIDSSIQHEEQLVSAISSKYRALTQENRELADEFLALLLRRQRVKDC